MHANRFLWVFAVLVSLLTSHLSRAAISGLTRVATGVSSPLFATSAPGDRSRLFIVERTGGIRILNLQTGAVQATPFLTIPDVSTDGEGGLLGVAFHPNFFKQGQPGYGKFYVDLTTNSTTQTHIREYQVSPTDPNLADARSAREILSFSQPQTNHKGGWLGFSPNNQYLYIATGDGGGTDDNDTGHNAMTGNGQDKNTLLGKMLRIDPTGDDFPADATKNYSIPASNPFAGATAGADEIWAYGLRNPFRNSFDRATGDLWIGDVGQSAREEIDFEPANSPGGVNYGWRLREGFIATPTGGVGGTCSGCTDPVYDYQHVSGQFGGTVVTGGYVYRGPDPSVQGTYFFLDSRNTGSTTDDNYWTLNPADPIGTVANINSLLTANTGTHQFPSSFGEDAVGNLYITYLTSGEVYRIATAHIPGDYDYDGDVDTADYNVWRATVGLVSTTASADGNGNGVVDAADYVLWRKYNGTSLGSGAGSGAAVPEVATAACLLSGFGLLVMYPPFVRRRVRATIV
jgi:glucose/arabinose dehydrogenase